MTFLFWMTAIILVYVYLGYPVLLYLRAQNLPAQKVSTASTATEPEALPRVSLIISAYNEAAHIEAKIENARALDYPDNLLEIIVVSDASEDGTDEIVARHERVRLVRMAERSGKSLGLNKAMELAGGDIAVFTDANAMFDKQALLLMVGHFKDPQIGAVTGQQMYRDPDTSEPREENLYWRLETQLKRLESLSNSTVGGDGAIMALRKSLFTPLAYDDLSDYILPMRAVIAGFRNVYEPEAVCFENVAASYNKEFGRKKRIVNRAWRATMKVKEALNPFRHGWFAIYLLSHKVLRWLTLVFLVALLICNLWLLGKNPVYELALVTQLLLYLAAFVGWAGSRFEISLPSIVSVPYYFLLSHVAATIGIIEHYFGKRYAVWNVAR